MKAAFAAMPGVGVITTVLKPAAFLGGAIGKAFSSSVTGILSATTAMGAFGAATTIATAGLSLVVAAVAALGLATVGAGAAWVGSGLASTEGIDALAKTADKLGIGTEAMAGMAHAGEKAGVSFEGVAGSLEKLRGSIARAGAGGVVMRGALTDLGVDIAALKNQGVDEAFVSVAEALNRIPDPADRANRAVAILGESGEMMLRQTKGGIDGLKAAMRDAGDLGLGMSRANAEQVEQAKASITDMKAAFTGLGRTAAITIAPFVKLIAGGITDALKWVNKYREDIIDFAHGVEFAFKNFSDYVHLYFRKAQLWITEFANAVLHVFTDVLPQLFRSFGDMLYEGITTGFSGGFDKAWDKAVRDVKASMKRSSGTIETSIRESVDREQKELDSRKKKFLDDKKKAMGVNAAGSTGVVQGNRENAAVERGSSEAFSIIAKQNGDKMFKVANDQLKALIAIENAVKAKKAGKAGVKKAVM